MGELKWPSIEDLPKAPNGQTCAKKPFMNDVVLYIALLKVVKCQINNGTVPSYTYAEAKDLVQKSLVNRQASQTTISEMIHLLTSSSDQQKDKMRSDIRLISKGNEDEILPFENIEVFKKKQDIKNAFDQVTLGGTKIESISVYTRQIQEVNSEASYNKVKVFFHRKIILSLLHVFYTKHKFARSASDQHYLQELNAYKKIHGLIVLSSANTETFRKERNVLLKAYSFEAIHKPNFQPRDQFSKIVLDAENVEDTSNTKKADHAMLSEREKQKWKEIRQVIDQIKPTSWEECLNLAKLQIKNQSAKYKYAVEKHYRVDEECDEITGKFKALQDSESEGEWVPEKRAKQTVATGTERRVTRASRNESHALESNVETERNKRTKRKQARRERIKEKSTADSDGEWLPVGKVENQSLWFIEEPVNSSQGLNSTDASFSKSAEVNFEDSWFLKVESSDSESNE